LQIVDRAKVHIENIKVGIKTADQEWLDELKETYIKNETVQFSNKDSPVGNKMLLEAL
jgi:hypothetical protein